ncbi:KAT8 regulatory NSL complex subunit 1-like protein [Colossoma macropomum]|uniref:KAT8 regulatory NSL complex subunit 1-like protein n=1 Tax=Colossoma macropomum TaxID=42526 RepID=UPI001864EE21|nr:KAT8 regulatory NSL complex subunit 1-like protein [Colossoma macropomum]
MVLDDLRLLASFWWEVCSTGMTPALSKSSDKVRRVHISSSVFTGHMESNGSVLGMDVDPPLKLLDDSYAHRFWLNLSSLPFLDSYSSKDPLELTEMLLPSLFHNPESFKTVLLSNQGSLLDCLSMDKNGADSAVSTTVSPDVCFPVYEDSRMTAVEKPTSEQPDSSTEHYQGVTQSPPPQQCPQGESSSPDNAAQLRHPAVRPQEANHIKQHDADTLRHIWHSSSQTEPSAMQGTPKARTEWLASRHGSLVARADRANRRLHALLGEHAVQHCTSELQGLGRKLHQEGSSLRASFLATGSFSSPETKAFDAPVEQTGLSNPPDCSSSQRRSQSVQKTKEMQSLAQCGQAVLQGVQKALDSDATASSSDEEWDHEETQATRAASDCLGCEWRWQCERAELASCWTWLQLRLSELDCRIQQLGELHQHILDSKGNVVLAESRPLTDRQIQQMLLTETAGLALTAGNMNDMTAELDTEPSSPARLLWNIERQSAQLSHIVKNLMAPLSVSPSSSPVTKGICSHWRGQQKRPFSSFSDVFPCADSTCFGEAGQKKRRLCRRRRRPPQVDVTCVCARTRPLLTYHKPRLFSMGQSLLRQQGPDPSAYLCASCASCDPVSVCSDPACSSTVESTANRAHPVLSLSSESSLSFHLRMGLTREDWLRQTSPLHSFTSAGNTSRSLFNCRHQLPAAKHSRTHRRESTPIRWAHACQEPPRRSRRRRALKRTHHLADTNVCLPQSGVLCPSPEDSAEEATTPNSTRTQQRNSQLPVRRRNGKSVYCINNMVIPMSLAASAKVEKPQYKDILTPSWRIVDIVPLVKKEEEEEESADEVELLSDEVFSQRHQSYESREKLRWGSWEKGRRSTRRTRSAVFSSSDCMNGSDRHFSANVHGPEQVCYGQSWAQSTLRAPPELRLEERQPRLPWEKRVFPLSREEEDALICEDASKAVDALWAKREEMELSLSDGSCENSLSSFCCAATTSPAGRTGKDTPWPC